MIRLKGLVFGGFTQECDFRTNVQQLKTKHQNTRSVFGKPRITFSQRSLDSHIIKSTTRNYIDILV